MNAYKADNPANPAQHVIILSQDITLPGVLSHLEAGNTVLIIPTPGTNARPKPTQT